MPANKTRVWKSRGQYLITIPRALAEALDLAGATLEWVPAGKDKMVVRIRRRHNEHQ